MWLPASPIACRSVRLRFRARCTEFGFSRAAYIGSSWHILIPLIVFKSAALSRVIFVRLLQALQLFLCFLFDFR